MVIEVSLTTGRRILTEEISNLLHVYLKEGHSDPKLSLIRIFLNIVENVIDTSWYDTGFEVYLLCASFAVHVIEGDSRTEYSVCFAAPGLTVGHDYTIEAIQDIFDYWLCYLFIGIFLFRGRI